MALVRINLDTAAQEPDERLIDRIMREKPMPMLRVGVVTPNGNRIIPVAR